MPPLAASESLEGRAYVAAATIAGTTHVFGGSDGGQAWTVRSCMIHLGLFQPLKKNLLIGEDLIMNSRD